MSSASDAATVVDRLRRLFLERFHIEVPSADTDLLATGMLDSLQLVELLLQIEQVFGLRIPIESVDLDDLRSLSRLASLVGNATHDSIRDGLDSRVQA